MTIEVMNDKSVTTSGYAILTLRRRHEGDLVFAIQLPDGHYLGEIGSRMRGLHLFTAPKVRDTFAGSQFRIGPEITRYIEAGEKLTLRGPLNESLGELFWENVTPPLTDGHKSGTVGWIPDLDYKNERYQKEPKKPLPTEVEEERIRKRREEERRRKAAEQRQLGMPPVAKPKLPPAVPENKKKRFWTGRNIAVVAVLLILGAGGFLINNPRLMCQIFGLGCGDDQAWTEAQGCASASDVCRRDVCYARYLDAFPRGAFIQQARMARDTTQNECRRRDTEEWEEEGVYQQARSCMQQRACDAEECARPYRARYPNGRFTQQFTDGIRVAGQECQVTRQAEEQRRGDEELARSEQEVFNLAMTCFNSRGACAAGGCFDSYLQQYPNGRFSAAARSKTAGAQNQCVLPNGVYSATRGYTNPNRPSQDSECPDVDELEVRIENGTIVFRGGGDRVFRGTVNQETGIIRIETNDITPATRTPFLISGRYDNAQMHNGFCLEGSFQIAR